MSTDHKQKFFIHENPIPQSPNTNFTQEVIINTNTNEKISKSFNLIWTEPFQFGCLDPSVSEYIKDHNGFGKILKVTIRMRTPANWPRAGEVNMPYGIINYHKEKITVHDLKDVDKAEWVNYALPNHD